MEQDKSASLSVLLYYYNWSVTGFVVLRWWLSLSQANIIVHTSSHTHHSCWFISSAWLNTAGAQLQLQIDRLSPPRCFSISATHRSACLYPGLEQLLSITWQKKSSYKKLLWGNAREHCSYSYFKLNVCWRTNWNKKDSYVCLIFFYGKQ